MAKLMFHISELDLGPKPTLTVRLPRHSLPKQEGYTPRVCFAPSILHCMLAIVGYQPCTWMDALEVFMPTTWVPEVSNPVVYTTEVRLHKPDQKKADFALTGERWSLTDIQVTRFGYLNLQGMVLKFADSQLVVKRAKSKFTRAEFRCWHAARAASQIQLRKCL